MADVVRKITLTDYNNGSGPAYNVEYSTDCITYSQSLDCTNLFLPTVGSFGFCTVDDNTTCVRLTSLNATCTNSVIEDLRPTTTSTTLSPTTSTTLAPTTSTTLAPTTTVAPTTTTLSPTTTTTLSPTTTTTQAPNTCPYSIGDLAEGGVIAYILQSGDPGYDVNQQKGLVATLADISTGAAWGCQGTLIAGADGSAIGTGNQNTIDIMAGCATAGIAARLCGDLVQGGYSDWYLPSRDELNKLYINRVAIGGFTTNDYWSSTEASSTGAGTQQFSSGTQVNQTKSTTLYVRAVRSFQCPATPTTTTTLAPTTTTTLSPTTTTTLSPTTTVAPTTTTTLSPTTTLAPTTTTTLPPKNWLATYCPGQALSGSVELRDLSGTLTAGSVVKFNAGGEPYCATLVSEKSPFIFFTITQSGFANCDVCTGITTTTTAAPTTTTTTAAPTTTTTTGVQFYYLARLCGSTTGQVAVTSNVELSINQSVKFGFSTDCYFIFDTRPPGAGNTPTQIFADCDTCNNVTTTTSTTLAPTTTTTTTTQAPTTTTTTQAPTTTTTLVGICRNIWVNDNVDSSRYGLRYTLPGTGQTDVIFDNLSGVPFFIGGNAGVVYSVCSTTVPYYIIQEQDCLRLVLLYP